MRLTDLTDFLGISNVKAREAKPPKIIENTPEKLGPRKTLYKWTAPERIPLSTIKPKMMKSLFIIGGVVGMFLVLLGEFPIILVLASVIFVAFVLANTPINDAEYELSTHGVEINKQFYFWKDLAQFFIKEETKELKTLCIDTKLEIPARLFLTIKSEDHDKIREICETYLAYLEEPPYTWLDGLYKKVTSQLDL